jgi:hypothetical protein
MTTAETAKLIVCILAGIQAWTMFTAAVIYFWNRSGRSGRDTHHLNNPRIRQPGENA